MVGGQAEHPEPGDGGDASARGKAPPTHSVVIAAHESSDRIALTIASVLRQTSSDLELVVVDDGSRDRTAEVVAEIATNEPRLRLIRQQNLGTVGARNRGLAATSGRIISFLDDDDLWLSGYLERIADVFARSPSAGIAFTDAWVMDAPSGRVTARSALERFAAPIRRLPPELDPAEALAALLRVNFLTTCATALTREALEAAGPLDPTIEGADDWDLWLRIVAAGGGIVRAGDRLAVLRKRPDSVGSDLEMMARNSARTLEAAIARGLPDRAERIARRHLRTIRLELRSLRSGRGKAVARLGRRVGRKRLPGPATLGGRWQQPPAELRAELDRIELAATYRPVNER